MAAKRLDSELSETIEGYTGIAYDLMRVIEWCDIALSLPLGGTMNANETNAGTRTRQAVSTGILITYRRCFAKSSRRLKYPRHLREKVLTDPRLAKNHGRTMATANGYVAHSGNAFEMSVATVDLNTESLEVEDVRVQHRRYLLTDDKINIVKELAGIFHGELIAETESLLAKLRCETEAVALAHREQLPDAQDLSVDPGFVNPQEDR